ncbi:MAG: prenyltransferase [Dysgonamonadaceae bacterium]|jgi:1,4-dihydroxy-2-naphthoate octaprenyltransferase|nr:prenyltransferase [Dysgonamonadaceae bacterium]
MNIIRFWISNARYKALPQSLLPAVLAVCMASQTGGFSICPGLLAVFGVVMGHLAMNLFDDYFDYKVKGSEFRRTLAKKGFRSRITKCSYLISGEANLKQLLIACLTFGFLALSSGFFLYLYRGNVILLFALVTAVLGVSYSGAPLRLSYHGLGELFIGIIFGPLLMTGVYYSACGQLDWPVVFVSVPVGLLVANIVYTHAIMDYEPDMEAGKMTFAVLLKSKRRMLAALLCLLVTVYLSIIGGVAAGYLSPFYLLTLLTLPLSAALFYLMIEFVRHPEKKFSPRFWMGPMGHWKEMQALGVDWFMIRWFLARNLLSFFCLIVVIVSFISSF